MKEKNLSTPISNMDILISGLEFFVTFEFNDNLTVSTIWNTGETGDINGWEPKQSLLSAIQKRENDKKLFYSFSRPKDSMDLLRKSYFYSAQYNILSKCLSRLLLAPFNHGKSIRPATFFALANKVLRAAPLSNLVKSKDLETRILFAVLPDVISSTLKVLRDLVKVSREDLLLFIPDALNLIVGLCNELRQCSHPANGSIPFAQVRIQLYGFISTLCSVLGPNSGMEFIANVLIPLLVSDFLPSKAGVKLAAVSKKSVSKKQQRLATRSDAETREGLQQKSGLFMSLRCLIFFKVGPPKEDIFSGHLISPIFQSSLSPIFQSSLHVTFTFLALEAAQVLCLTMFLNPHVGPLTEYSINFVN